MSTHSITDLGNDECKYVIEYFSQALFTDDIIYQIISSGSYSTEQEARISMNTMLRILIDSKITRFLEIKTCTVFLVTKIKN